MLQHFPEQKLMRVTDSFGFIKNEIQKLDVLLIAVAAFLGKLTKILLVEQPPLQKNQMEK